MALHEIKIEWDTFNFKVWCVIGSHRYLRAYIKRRHRRVYRDTVSDDCGGLYFASRPWHGGILWLAKKPQTPKDIGYLAHEVGHAVMDMHAKRGIKFDPFNDEPFCYAIGHGVTTVLRGCK